jgi:hypothetical protein
MDTSWINDEDIEESILEKEAMNEIQCFYIYVGMNQNINNVTKKIQNLEIYNAKEDHRIIPRDQLLQMIHSNKTYLSKKYRLLEILLYNIDTLSSDTLFTVGEELCFSKMVNEGCDTTSTLKTVTTLDEILIPPSLCIFHETNCLYFIFQEIYQYKDNHMTKPILNIMSDILPRTQGKKTKRVAFKEDIRHTKKRITN